MAAPGGSAVSIHNKPCVPDLRGFLFRAWPDFLPIPTALFTWAPAVEMGGPSIRPPWTSAPSERTIVRAEHDSLTFSTTHGGGRATGVQA